MDALKIVLAVGLVAIVGAAWANAQGSGLGKGMSWSTQGYATQDEYRDAKHAAALAQVTDSELRSQMEAHHAIMDKIRAGTATDAEKAAAQEWFESGKCPNQASRTQGASCGQGRGLGRCGRNSAAQ